MELVYQDAAGKKARLSLTDLNEVLIGRHRDCNLRTDNPSVSRRHAKMTCSGGDWSVEDLGSSNHTFVNGTEATRASFKLGDTVRCGEFVLKVEEGLGKAPVPSAAVDASQPSGSVEDRRSRRAALEEERDRRRKERSERRARQRDDQESDPEDVDALEFAEVAPESVPVASTTPASQEVPEPVAEPVAPAAPKVDSTPPSQETDRKKALEERRAKRRSGGGDSIDASLSTDRGQSGARASGSDPRSDQRELREAKEQVGSLKRDLAESQVRVDELKARVHELEQREARHEEELDGWHDRYNRAREQVDHVQTLVDETRADLEESTSRGEELEGRVVDLEGQLGTVEARQSEETALLTELKTRLVQKDRRIDELQRELDLMEYDLRGSREELESLQDSFNQDNSQQRQLEREQELLREIMSEKENVIGELKIQIEDKDREIYDLKMGTGVMDLEQAKSDVLEKYFDKNRECDELQEKMKGVKREGEEFRARIDELEGRLSDSKDITEHPDFQRKMREVERAQADLEEAKDAYTKLEERLEDFGPAAKGKLDAQINFLERKNTAIQEKLDGARQELEESKSNPTPTDSSPATEISETDDDGATGQIGQQALVRARALEKHSLVSELFSGWRSNLKLLQSYMDELADAVEEEGNTADPIESVGEVLTVLTSDSKEMRTELREMESILTE
jgi:pSer/pThr/pTyr-binding forkhead associated (FHA) protein